MAIPFSRSIRSMKQDRFRPGMITILVIGLILVLWIIWFFVGQLSIYGTTEKVAIRNDGMLLAYFPSEIIPQIKPGQAAELIFPSQEGKSKTPIRGEVMKIPMRPGNPAEVYLFSEKIAPGELKGQVKVLLEKISPAQLIWRSVQK